ncbi:MAG: dihydrodipicolinate synthase family protein [Verrucomicrobia bacterium]|nr:dihydrodipicolinate synthase family protein [Verrucomicrobiota bacterium]
MKQPLTGIIPPMLTPLRGIDELDGDGLAKLTEHILAGGVHGLFILGTTGEGPSLGYRLRRELIERVCRQVQGRVPVLVGITDTAFVESVALARQAADAGADAVVLAPPYYMPEGQPELREYLAHLLPELPRPLFLYNMPPLTKVPFELETVRWALDQPRIAGMKDSSGNMTYFNQALGLARQRPDWTLLTGPEELLAESVLMGGHGGVNGGANIFPALYVATFEAARSGDLIRARELQRRIQSVVDKLYRVGQHPSAVIKGIKCAASCLGLCSDFMAEPFHRFRDPERRRIEEGMAELRAIVAWK